MLIIKVTLEVLKEKMSGTKMTQGWTDKSHREDNHEMKRMSFKPPEHTKLKTRYSQTRASCR